MKNSELIEKLQQLPPDMEVCIFDYLKNINDDYGDQEGCSGGIYSGFEVGMENQPEEGLEKPPAFIVLAFANTDYAELEEILKSKGLTLMRRCRVCGCTDNDCRQCIEKTGQPCHWVEADLCSACVPQQSSLLLPGRDF
jgi:hypothetical protein